MNKQHNSQVQKPSSVCLIILHAVGRVKGSTRSICKWVKSDFKLLRFIVLKKSQHFIYILFIINSFIFWYNQNQSFQLVFPLLSVLYILVQKRYSSWINHISLCVFCVASMLEKREKKREHAHWFAALEVSWLHKLAFYTNTHLLQVVLNSRIKCESWDRKMQNYMVQSLLLFCQWFDSKLCYSTS